ncbi:MAG: DegT/DnrJ/EryC1/StrS family aminotransferase [Candidatus Bathyarchaeota archaeon]|nr:MAG: DegT/DnrJ/EryC1/StrS family aminotransferase [Candidatus Bathyarchaeota archaeon]
MTKGVLAINGGEPIREEVLSFVPVEADVEKEDIEAISEVLSSKRLSQLVSKKVNDFEESFAEYIETKHAIAVNSGTAALHVALAAASTGPANDVILPPYTFVATANAILHQSAVPNFADIDPSTYNLDPREFEKKITPKTKAVVAVHMLGQPAEMDSIVRIAEKHNVVVVEDCAQAIGAEYRGNKVGTFGDLGCFSFYLNKHMTTGGEGGMVVTDNGELAQKVRSIANHCRATTSPYPQVPAHNVYWGIGYNYRMTAVQASMGISQLRRLDGFIERRRRNAKYLTKSLENISGIRPPFESPHGKHVYWAYGALVLQREMGVSRDDFARALLAEGVKAEGYCPIPVHLQDVFKLKAGYGDTTFPFDNPLYGGKLIYEKGLCPKAEKLSSQDLLLPVYHTLTEDDLTDVVTGVKKIVENIDELKDRTEVLHSPP